MTLVRELSASSGTTDNSQAMMAFDKPTDNPNAMLRESSLVDVDIGWRFGY
jgi:hypothetical protein